MSPNAIMLSRRDIQSELDEYINTQIDKLSAEDSSNKGQEVLERIRILYGAICRSSEKSAKLYRRLGLGYKYLNPKNNDIGCVAVNLDGGRAQIVATWGVLPEKVDFDVSVLSQIVYLA